MFLHCLFKQLGNPSTQEYGYSYIAVSFFQNPQNFYQLFSPRLSHPSTAMVANTNIDEYIIRATLSRCSSLFFNSLVLLLSVFPVVAAEIPALSLDVSDLYIHTECRKKGPLWEPTNFSKWV